MSDSSARKTPTAMTRMGTAAKQWLATFVAPGKTITPADSFKFGVSGITTVATLLGSGRRSARQRHLIYEKWAAMEADPIVSSALLLLVTSALGGSETSGDIVYIEAQPDARNDRQKQKMVAEISAALSALFNQKAFQLAYTGCVFGDAYARIYADGSGVKDLYADELVRPPLVQPFERGSQTVGYSVAVGKNNLERLDITQMARLKMPRTQWVPQHGVVEKSLHLAIAENDVEALPVLPGMAGGSLLYNAEEPWENLCAALLGLVGQRWMDSIDEQIITANMEAMSDAQQQQFSQSVVEMVRRSKQLAENAVKNGRPLLERIRSVVPTWGEKGTLQIIPANGGTSGRSATISIDDVMVHARLLSGALGVDLSMIGFADQMSGGLGEGGFFRASAQAAERARIIRIALEDFFNQVIDIHTLNRYGRVFAAHERPWEIQFYGSISALEAEQQRTRLEAASTAANILQSMMQMKELGMNAEMMQLFLTKTLQLDEDQAHIYSQLAQSNHSDIGTDGP